jgi:spermidine synthase
MRARLTPGGVLQQWVQLHHIRRSELAAIVRTLRSVFPHVALFLGGEQGILVASPEPLVASAARLDRLSAHPPIREMMGGTPLESLFGEMLTSGVDLDRFVAESDARPEDATLSTDDNLYLEYATPKGNVLNFEASLRETIATLERYRSPDPKARHLGP